MVSTTLPEIISKRSPDGILPTRREATVEASLVSFHRCRRILRLIIPTYPFRSWPLMGLATAVESQAYRVFIPSQWSKTRTTIYLEPMGCGLERRHDLDGNNELAHTYNVTTYNLYDAANYDALKQLFIDTANGSKPSLKCRSIRCGNQLSALQNWRFR